MCAACGGEYIVFNNKYPKKKKNKKKRIRNQINIFLKHPVPVKIKQPKLDNNSFQLVDRSREVIIRRLKLKSSARSKSISISK